MRGLAVVIASIVIAAAANAQRAPLVQPFVSVDAPAIVLLDARVIDGTGAPPREHQTIVIKDGRIAAVGSGKLAIPPGARIIGLAGKTVLPGLVNVGLR